VEAGPPEGFVGVDVAQAGELPLVHEQRLQGTGASPQYRSQLRDCDAIRFRTEPAEKADFEVERAPVQTGSAEPPHVAETEFLVKVGQAEHQVRMLISGLTRAGKKQLPGHAQVDGKRRSASAAGEVKEDVLAPSIHRCHPRTPQSARLEIAHGAGEQPSAAYPPADQVRAEPAHDRLDLGQFRHLVSPTSCVQVV
jgi:hypothetical protein